MCAISARVGVLECNGSQQEGGMLLEVLGGRGSVFKGGGVVLGRSWIQCHVIDYSWPLAPFAPLYSRVNGSVFWAKFEASNIQQWHSTSRA